MAVSVEAGGNTFTMANGDALTGDYLGHRFIKEVRWIAPTTTGHTLTLTNVGGKVVQKATCEAASVDISLPINEWVNGLTVACTSGTVVVKQG